MWAAQGVKMWGIERGAAGTVGEIGEMGVNRKTGKPENRKTGKPETEKGS